MTLNPALAAGFSFFSGRLFAPRRKRFTFAIGFCGGSTYIRSDDAPQAKSRAAQRHE
jgi:hypothetical protein